MRILIGLSLTCILQVGCSSTNISDSIKALGDDKADVCVTASSPYGGGAYGRLNTPGSKLNASGGQCSMEIAK
jgi:hypothetical protein